jgi:hypothetical protein
MSTLSRGKPDRKIRIMNRPGLLLAVALALASGAVHAAPPTPVVVELFTSEGCSDCPPADTLLEKLIATQPVAGAEIIGLGQHVDYWDRLGWKDRFSSAALTSRQQAYQTRFGTESIYTPQMVVDGRAEFVGSDEAAARKAIGRALTAPHGIVTIDVTNVGAELAPPAAAAPARAEQARPVRVGVTVTHLPQVARGDRADIIVLVTERGLRTDVKRGENHGRTLLHAPVVRYLATIGHIADDGAPVGATRADIPLAADWQLDHLAVVAFVQQVRDRTILASASVPLKNAHP